MHSFDYFAALTKRASFQLNPFIVLLNKFDLFKKYLPSKPVRDYFPSYHGSPDPSLACRFFADEFVRLDERPNASLRIYTTSAVDQDSFKPTIDSMIQWL